MLEPNWLIVDAWCATVKKTNCTLQSKMNHNPQIDYVTEFNHGSSSLKSGDFYWFGLKHCALNCAVVGSRPPHCVGCYAVQPCHIFRWLFLSKLSQKTQKVTHLHRRCPLGFIPKRTNLSWYIRSASCVMRKAAVAAAPASAGEKFSNPFGVCWIPGGSSLLNHPHGQSKVSWGRRMGAISCSRWMIRFLNPE